MGDTFTVTVDFNVPATDEEEAVALVAASLAAVQEHGTESPLRDYWLREVT